MRRPFSARRVTPLRAARAARALLVLLVLGLAACGRPDRSQSAEPRQALTGAGATFPYPLYSRWTSSYLQLADVRINYLSVGSAEGIRLLTAGTIDFAGSDLPLSPRALDSLGCGGAIQVPTVAGAVAIAYHIPGVDTLITLDRESLAGIFSGRIVRWDAPEITRQNPTFTFPPLRIRVVHRSSGSGTSAAFAAYLRGTRSWHPRSDDDLWPVGIAEEGNEGVAARVRQTRGAIGYMEIAYARQNLLRTARIADAGGHPVAPSVAGVRKALESVSVAHLEQTEAVVNSPVPGAYPIVAVSWFVVPKRIAEPARRDRTVAFLHWALTDGTGDAGALEYVPLPRETITHYDSLVGTIASGACPKAPSP